MVLKMHGSSVRFLQRRSTLNPRLLKGHRNRDSGGGVLQVKCLFGLCFPHPGRNVSLRTLSAAGDQVSIIHAELWGGRSWSWTTVTDLIYYYFVSSGLREKKSRLVAERLRPQVCCSAHRSLWGMEVRFKDQVVSGDRGKQSKVFLC